LSGPPIAKKRFLIRVDNSGYEASLERCKVYETTPDAAAAKRNLIRVVDESGDSDLYADEIVVLVSLPDSIRKAVLQAT
jgi:hypothetical protein